MQEKFQFMILGKSLRAEHLLLTDPLTIFAKHSIVDAWQGSGYTSARTSSSFNS